MKFPVTLWSGGTWCFICGVTYVRRRGRRAAYMSDRDKPSTATDSNEYLRHFIDRDPKSFAVSTQDRNRRLIACSLFDCLVIRLEDTFLPICKT